MYLQSCLNPEAGRDLADALELAGLQDESKALRSYFESGTEVTYQSETAPWSGRRCFTGPSLPTAAQPGDVWLDVVQLTPMILVPALRTAAAEKRRWVSMHPVYVWQFKAFLNLVRWRVVKKYFMAAPDLMLPSRFESLNNLSFATNLFHEEAVAYAHWFGNYLCRQFDLEAARNFLVPEQFSEILPPNMALWDEMEYGKSEFLRRAVRQSTIDADPDEEFETEGDYVNESRPDRMLYKEWERKPDVGLSTAVLCEVGLIQKTPLLAYEFVELLNAAPRNPKDGNECEGR